MMFLLYSWQKLTTWMFVKDEHRYKQKVRCPFFKAISAKEALIFFTRNTYTTYTSWLYPALQHSFFHFYERKNCLMYQTFCLESPYDQKDALYNTITLFNVILIVTRGLMLAAGDTTKWYIKSLNLKTIAAYFHSFSLFSWLIRKDNFVYCLCFLKDSVLNKLSNIPNTRKIVLSGFPNTEKWVYEKRDAAECF